MTSKAPYFDRLWTRTVTVPLLWSEGRWVLPNGAALAVKDGARAQLTLPLSNLLDLADREELIRPVKCKVFEPGQALYVALSDQCNNGGRVGPWPDHYPTGTPPGTTRWERILIGAKPADPAAEFEEDQSEAEFDAYRPGNKDDADQFGLFIRFKGPFQCELTTKVVLMPEGFDLPTAQSLNHAYTLLSERYETHRSTHNANIYAKVFYEERTGRWHPLDDLRGRVRHPEEHPVAHQLWCDIDAEFAKPAPPPVSSRKRKSP